MCVILVGDAKARPSRSTLQRCAARNGDGIGFAWLDADRQVHWVKGFHKVTRALELIDAAPDGWALHFRYATEGVVGTSLCHPFEISREASIELSGSGTAPVMFHNGTWRKWRDHAQELTLGADVTIPDGPFSDSRAIAWISAHKGWRFLRLLPGRFVVVSRKAGIKIFPDDFAGWSRGDDGVWYSNLDWKSKPARNYTNAAEWTGEGSQTTLPTVGAAGDAVPYGAGAPSGTRSRTRTSETGSANSSSGKSKRRRRRRGGKHRKPTTKPQPSKPRRLGQRR